MSTIQSPSTKVCFLLHFIFKQLDFGCLWAFFVDFTHNHKSLKVTIGTILFFESTKQTDFDIMSVFVGSFYN